MKYNKVEISEQQLEDLVRQYADKIEDGLRYVDHQKQTDTGRLDGILVDSGGALVLAELKVSENDGMLLQAVDYYDDVCAQIERYARLYKTFKIDPTQEVRLFLIAPSFSIACITRCKWLDIPISLFTYACIRLEGEAGTIPVFTEVALPATIAKVETFTIDQHLEYVTDEKTRTRIHSLVDEVKGWMPTHVSIDPIKAAISLKVDGTVFAYLGMRRKHFVIATFNADDKWTAYAIHNDDDMIAAKPIMKACFEKKRK